MDSLARQRNPTPQIDWRLGTAVGGRSRARLMPYGRHSWDGASAMDACGARGTVRRRLRPGSRIRRLASDSPGFIAPCGVLVRLPLRPPPTVVSTWRPLLRPVQMERFPNDRRPDAEQTQDQVDARARLGHFDDLRQHHLVFWRLAQRDGDLETAEPCSAGHDSTVDTQELPPGDRWTIRPGCIYGSRGVWFQASSPG